VVSSFNFFFYLIRKREEKRFSFFFFKKKKKLEFVRQSLEDLFQLVPEEEWNEKVISEVMQALSNKEFHGKKQKFKDFMLATRFLLTKHDVITFFFCFSFKLYLTNFFFFFYLKVGASLVGTIVILSKNVCLKRLSEMKTIIQK